MAKNETLCLRCGFSPIPDGVEACPRCGSAFAPDRVDYTNVTGTRAGGLTGSVTASPGPVALAIVLGVVPWLMRGLGLPTSFNEPVLVLVAPVVLIAAAAMVMANVGPAKHAAALAGVLEILLALLLLAAPTGLAVAAVLHGVVLIAATVREPGRGRMWAGVGGAGVAAAVGAMVAATSVPEVKPGFTWQDERSGVRLTLGVTWRAEIREHFTNHLRWPLDGGKTVNVGFVRPFPEAVGMLSVSREELGELDEGCTAALAPLGVTEPMTPVPGAVALLPESILGDVRVASGAVGRALCGRHQGRFIALVVVAADPAPGEGVKAFDEVVRGVSLGP